MALSRLEPTASCCHHWPVKYLPLLAAALLAGCETPQHSTRSKYTKLSVTDQTGDTIAEWVAEGKVEKTDQGYEIHAVERRTGPPDVITAQYPNGRAATVVGPNIVLDQIEKPEWLRKLDEDEPETGGTGTGALSPAARRDTR